MKPKKQNKQSRIGVKVSMDKVNVPYAKRTKDQLGVIVFKGSRDIDMCEVTFETDDETFAKVAGIGKDLIKDDKHKLFGYAINRALEEVIAEEKAKKGKSCSKN